ncbi:MAG: IPT/TIG domain-containing protein [Chitinophagaceae bacterium]|nr:IPT/TIG domain-containing protein [Chitinophagaceae bacterium]
MKQTLLLCVSSTLFLFSCKKDETTPPPAPEPSPTITSISPTAGPKNTVVTITGTNYGTNAAAVKVYFNGVQGTVQSITATQLTATVPAAAGTGAVKVEKNSVQVTGPVFTYHGNGMTTTFSLTGTATSLNHPSGITKDAAGNLFVCDRDNHRILKITPAGVSAVFAGGTMGFTNGTGVAAQFNQPYAITIDGAGNLYVGDRINHAIRKITSAGVVTTLAGNGSAGFVNGTGSAASFAEPLGVTVDAAGNVFVADYLNSAIRKVTSAGVVTTVTTVPQIFGITVDAAGNLYFTEYGQHKVSKYSSTGTYSVLAGDASGGNADGTGAAARFNFPAGILLDATGNLYVTETINHRIRKITPAGVVTTIAGNTGGYADGAGVSALFDSPIAICGDFANSTAFIADFNNHKIRKMIIE